jgi:hypothetical protein
MTSAVKECLSIIARAQPRQLDDVSKLIAATHHAGRLSDSEASRCWEAIDRRRKAAPRSAPSLPFGRKPQKVAAPLGPPGALPSGQFQKDREIWTRQIVADVELERLALRFANLIAAKYLQSNPRNPYYLSAYPSLETLARELGARNQLVLEARHQLQARGHIEVIPRRGQGRTTIIALRFKPTESYSKNCSDEEQFARMTRAEAGIDRKLLLPAPRDSQAANRAHVHDLPPPETAEPGTRGNATHVSHLPTTELIKPPPGVAVLLSRPGDARAPAPPTKEELAAAEAARIESQKREEFIDWCVANQARGPLWTYDYDPYERP